MRIPFLFVCEHAHVCPSRLSATGILRELKIPEVPWTVPQLFLGYEMEFSYSELQDDRESKYHVRIRLQDEDGQKVFDHQRTMGAKGTAPDGETVGLFEALGIGHATFRRAGPHTVTLFVNDQEKARYRFKVIVDPPKEGPRQISARKRKKGG